MDVYVLNKFLQGFKECFRCIHNTYELKLSLGYSQMALNISIVDGKFVLNGITYNTISFAEGCKITTMDTDLHPCIAYQCPIQVTDYHHPAAEPITFEDEDYTTCDDVTYTKFLSCHHDDIYWKLTMGDGTVYVVKPTNQVDLDIPFYDCRGDKCRRKIDPSSDHWCTACHGSPGDTCTWWNIYDTLYGFPKTWGELLTSPLKLITKL